MNHDNEAHIVRDYDSLVNNPYLKGQTTLNLLAEAWNSFLAEFGKNTTINGVVNDDLNDYRQAILNAQRIILAKQKRDLDWLLKHKQKQFIIDLLFPEDANTPNQI